jgi:thiamine pyrophosphokinase
VRGGREQGCQEARRATGLTVILANGTPPAHPVPLRIFREADRLIACDGAWRKALDLGRPPDAVVGDGDSLGEEGREALAQRGIPFIGAVEQETNDLCKAFRHAVATGEEEDTFVILGATGRREDHALGNIFHLLDFAADIPRGADGTGEPAVSMVTDFGTFEPVLPPGGTWTVAAGRSVSVFAPVPGTRMTSEGLAWPLEGVSLDALWRGTLNRTTGDTFTLRTTHPILLYLPH